MFGLDHFGGAVELQSLRIAPIVGHRNHQVERLARRHEHRALIGALHRVERVKHQPGKGGATERRFEPARAHEIRQLAPDLLALPHLDRFVDHAAAPLARHPRNRHRPKFGEARQGTRVGVHQMLDIGAFEPQVGQRVERLAGQRRLCQEYAVDAARACARDDIAEYAQPRPRSVFEHSQQFAVDRSAAALHFGAIVPRAAGARKVPDLLGDAVHVNRKADASVANESQPEFLFAHIFKLGSRRLRVERDALDLGDGHASAASLPVAATQGLA